MARVPHAVEMRSEISLSKVLVVGAGGYFGSLLVRELLEYTDCDVIAAGRSYKHLSDKLFKFKNSRLSFEVVDLKNSESVERLLSEAQVAICAAGPFQNLPLTLLELCLKKRVHYIDFSDDRQFVKKVHETVNQIADKEYLPAICSGWSTFPALSGALTRIAVNGLEKADSITIQMAPGNRSPRAIATVTSLLSSVGSSFSVWRERHWQNVSGWSGAEPCHFPEPIGQRQGYLVDVPDHEIFPALFDVDSVEFRVAPEIHFFSQILSLMAWFRRKGFVRNWAPYAAVLRKAASLLGFLGHDSGAVSVEVLGTKKGIKSRKRVCIITDKEGQCIPVIPATIMVASLLKNELNHKGLVPVDDWIEKEDLQRECQKRNYRLIIEELC